MNDVTELQRRRAVNQIWNAAKDYRFAPDFKAFDENGNADLYWNSVIGAVRRHYDYPKLAQVLASFQQYEEADTYEGLFWLGLENAVYQKELAERPVLSALRRSYAERFVAAYGGRPLDDYQLFDCLACAHYQRVLGREPVLNRYDRKLLDELEFSPELDTDQIVARAKELFARWFQILAEERRRERKLPVLPLKKLRGKRGKSRFRRFGIDLLQAAVQDPGSLLPRFFLQRDPAGGIGVHLGKIDPVQEGLDIEARAPDEEGKASLLIDLPDGFLRLILKSDDVPVFRRFRGINEVVRDPLHLFGRDFGGADVHAAVDLHGVRRDDAPVHPFCQLDGDCGLSRRRRPGYDHEGRAAADINIRRSFRIIGVSVRDIQLIVIFVPLWDFFQGHACHSRIYTIRLNLRSSSCWLMTIMVGLPWGQ